MNNTLHNQDELRLKRPVSAYMTLAIFFVIASGVILARTMAVGYSFIIVGIIELLIAWRYFGGYYVKITRDRVKIRQLFSGKFRISDIRKVVYISRGYTIHVKGGKEYRIELDNMDASSQEKARAYFEPMASDHIV